MDPLSRPDLPDLATVDKWYGLSLGMPRHEAVAQLPAEIGAHAVDEESPEWLSVEEWGLELTFDSEGEQRLRQVVLTDPRWRWRGKALLGMPLHLTLQTLGEHTRDAGWRSENAQAEPLADIGPLAPGQISDEHLLAGGTLWLPALRLGLVMEYGRLAALAWRFAEDLPRVTARGITPEQLTISARPDLEEYLTEGASRSASRIAVWLQVALTLAWLTTLASFAVHGARERKRWQTAPHATARVVEIATRATNSNEQLVWVVFTDAAGHEQRASIPGFAFYTIPRAQGETVEVTYLPTDPLQVLGPAGVHEAAYVRYLPWALVATILYCVFMGATRWVASRENSPAGVPI